MPAGRRWSEEARQEAVRAYLTGGVEAAMEASGASRAAVYRWVKDLLPSTAPRPATGQRAPVLDTSGPGWVARRDDLAAMLGVTASKVLAQVCQQLDQGRPVPPRDAAMLLDVALRHAEALTRGRTVPADVRGRAAELEHMMATLAASNVRPIRRRRKQA